ncbi:unnamed protein product, partial [Cyprideis torosa]
MKYPIGCFVHEVPTLFVCAVCEHVVHDPVQVDPCEHLFCRVCAEDRRIQDEHTCPKCQSRISDSFQEPATNVLRVLRDMAVKCPDCSRQAPYSEMERHMELCRTETTPCQKGCGQPLLYSEVAAHDCFELSKKRIAELEAKIEGLETDLEALTETQEDLEKCRKRVGTLEKELEDEKRKIEDKTKTKTMRKKELEVQELVKDLSVQNREVEQLRTGILEMKDKIGAQIEAAHAETARGTLSPVVLKPIVANGGSSLMSSSSSSASSTDSTFVPPSSTRESNPEPSISLSSTDEKPAGIGGLFANLNFGAAFSSGAPSFAQLAEEISGKREAGEQAGSIFGSTSPATEPPTLQSMPLFTSLTGNNNTSPSAPGDRRHDDSKEVEEYEPSVHFEPLIPLPPLVRVETGEEGYEDVFCERAKLHRFDSSTKEWKERGLGELKVQRQTSGPLVARVLMRREKIHKICANFSITPQLELKRFQDKENVVLIPVAADFSEGELAMEMLLVKFKEETQAKRFRETVDSLKKEMQRGATPPQTTPVSQPKEAPPTLAPAASSAPAASLPPLSALFKPAEGSWTCTTCYVTNKGETTVCVSCETPKPGTEAPPAPPPAPKFSFGFGGAPSAPPASTSSAAFPPKPSFTFGTPTSSTGFSFSKPVATSTPVPNRLRFTAAPMALQHRKPFAFALPKTNAATTAPPTGGTSTAPVLPSFGAGATAAPSFSFSKPIPSVGSATSASSPLLTKSLQQPPAPPSTTPPSFTIGLGKPKTTPPIRGRRESEGSDGYYHSDEEGEHLHFQVGSGGGTFGGS